VILPFGQWIDFREDTCFQEPSQVYLSLSLIWHWMNDMILRMETCG